MKAIQISTGAAIKTYDDFHGDYLGKLGKLFVIRDSFGVTMIIRNMNPHTAWDNYLDELPTGPPEMMYEAYGFKSHEEFKAAVKYAIDNDTEHPQLAEGYEYQANVTGTGIVFVGHDTSYPVEMTAAQIRDIYGIEVTFEDDEE